jgi:hypothetical protein
MMQALLKYLDSSEDIDKVVVVFKAGAALPGGVLELSVTFLADGKAITWHEVLDATSRGAAALSIEDILGLVAGVMLPTMI